MQAIIIIIGKTKLNNSSNPHISLKRCGEPDANAAECNPGISVFNSLWPVFTASLG